MSNFEKNSAKTLTDLGFRQTSDGNYSNGKNKAVYSPTKNSLQIDGGHTYNNTAAIKNSSKLKS